MSDVIPTGSTRDSEYLFARMTARTLDLAGAVPGRRILDVASGVGQDASALAARGATVIAAEPSRRMMALARMRLADQGGVSPHFVRSWSDGIPFRSGSFDAVICKGSIDHFDRPDRAIAEMARVTAPGGRVVLAIANFESFGCRAARAVDRARERWLWRPLPRGRRHYDVPSDHFTRYETSLMRQQAARWIHVDVVEGVSLAWGAPGWNRVVQALPGSAARAALAGLGAVAARAPAWADVVILAGRPRRSGL